MEKITVMRSVGGSVCWQSTGNSDANQCGFKQLIKQAHTECTDLLDSSHCVMAHQDPEVELYGVLQKMFIAKGIEGGKEYNKSSLLY
jgi:hypothetical protein